MPGWTIRTPVRPLPVGEASRLLWTALRSAQVPASIAELQAATGISPSTAQLRLSRWRRAGLVRAIGQNPKRFQIMGSNPHGQPLPFTPVSLQALVNVPGFVAGFTERYVAAYAGQAKEREGNLPRSVAAGQAAGGRRRRKS